MGIKVGQFGAKNGHTYEVRIEGNFVSDDTIDLGVPPVTISMAAGSSKFCGYKSTTAVINIVTEKMMTDLYADMANPINVTVFDLTTGGVEFAGRVAPFSFDRPLTGLDTISINAVDMLTANKHRKYTSVGSVYGADVMAIDIVKAICLRQGIKTFVVQLNFNTSSDIMASTSPLNVTVAQAGFLQDEMSDLDVVSAISQFFGYTAIMRGTTLYLYDEHAKSEDCNVYTYSGSWAMTHYYKSDSSPLALQRVSADDCRDMSLSIERAYDGVQITPSGRAVSVLLPDVCAGDNLEDDPALGILERPVAGTDKDKHEFLEYRLPRRSKVMQLGLYKGGGITAWDESNDPTDNADWLNGAVALNIKHAPSKSVKLYEGMDTMRDVVLWDMQKGANYIWARSKYTQTLGYVCVGRQHENTRYSHAGGTLKLTLKYRVSYNEDWKNIEEKINWQDLYAARFITVWCGDKCYVSDYAAPTWPDVVWGGTTGPSSFLAEEYSLLPTGIGQDMLTSEVLMDAPTNAPIYVEIGWGLLNSVGAINEDLNIYIESLMLEGYGDDIDTKCAGMRHLYGTNDTDIMEVTTALTTRNSTCHADGIGYGANARPGVVTATQWIAPYNGGTNTNIPLAGVLMEQVRERYEQPRRAYKMTVDGDVKPFAAVRYLGGVYSVDAYDRNLYDDETTITIN